MNGPLRSSALRRDSDMDSPATRPSQPAAAARERMRERDDAMAPDLVRHLSEDHDRIARQLNDLVVRRIFAVGLDLEAALALIGQHRAAEKIRHAIGELDQAIIDIRDTVFHQERWHRS